MDYQYLKKHRNEIFIVSEKTIDTLKIDREEAFKIDSYIDYNCNIKYTIKERCIDSFNNIILMCDEEFI